MRRRQRNLRNNIPAALRPGSPLDAYLDEFEWRFNGRNNPYLFRNTLMRLLNLPKMEFKELIEKNVISGSVS